MKFFIITDNQLRACVKIMEYSNDLDLIVVLVMKLGPEPTVHLPDELAVLDVSSYLPLSTLTKLVKDYEVVKSTTGAQQRAICAFVGLLIGEL